MTATEQPAAVIQEPFPVEPGSPPPMPPPAPSPKDLEDLAALKPVLAGSLELVNPAQVIADFYDQLFADHPELRGMFPTDMTRQHKQLTNAVGTAVDNLDRPDVLLPYLDAVGGNPHHRHLTPAHYEIVRDTFLAVLPPRAGRYWSDGLRTAWHRFLDFVAARMLAAGARAA